MKLSKAAARIKAYELASKAIMEYVEDGRVELNYGIGPVWEDIDRVEKSMLDLANSLRDKGNKMEGDDGQES